MERLRKDISMGVQKVKIELLYDTGISYLDINCNLC